MDLFHPHNSIPQPEKAALAKYFEDQVKPVYSTLIVSIVKSKPEDILEYCTKWFRDRKGDPNRAVDLENESEDDDNLF